jgi:hypothetical protein
MKRTLLTIIILTGIALAFSPTYKLPWTQWKSPEIAIAFSDSLHSPINPEDFCLSLVRVQSALGRPQCRIAGDWERDSASRVYLQWLGKNMDARVVDNHLLARNPAVMERLRRLDDQYLLVLSERNDSLWVAFFTGARISPNSIGAISPIPKDSRELAEIIAATWFTESPEPRLTPEQKKAISVAPDQAYAANHAFDAWIGLGIGWSQGSIPLTPSSWYASKLKDRIQKYRTVDDSLSLWSFLEDESPLQTVQAGFTWNGFIGAEAFLTRSNHQAKVDNSDTLYNELAYWDYTRYEFGMTAHITTHYSLPYSFEAMPHAFLGFHYSYLFEHIAVKDAASGREPSQSYDRRIHFLPFYKGAIFGVGNRILWKGTLALDTRTGISNRGRSLDREPSPDAVTSPTIIGGSTLDCFVSATLEYHFRDKTKASNP